MKQLQIGQSGTQRTNMNLKWSYWCFPSAIPTKICDNILEYGNSKKKKIALTTGIERNTLTKKELKNIQKKRKSDIV